MLKPPKLPAALQRLERLLTGILLPIAGMVLLLLAPYVAGYVGYLVGSAMLLTGLLMLPTAIRAKEYAIRENHKTSTSVVLILCSIVVLLKHDDCITLLGTAWGLYGILSGVKDLTEVIYRIAHRQRRLLLAIDTMVMLAFSLLLLWNPNGSFVFHLRLLGVELILLSLREDYDDKI
ncbi:MAG: hypothetical protein VB055_10160 [Oscillospiraceae bacterium]|nr:hypothetical protein [Oscillospiraceae bacterium]